MNPLRRHSPSPDTGRKKLVFPLFVSLLLIFSVMGVVFSSYTQDSPSSSVSYRDYTFTRAPQGQGWTTSFQGSPLILWHTPDEILSIDSFFPLLSSLRQASKVYLSRDPRAPLAVAERDLYQTLKPRLPLYLACPSDIPECSQSPLRTCADARPDTFVIQFEVREEVSIKRQDSCVIFQGDPQSITQAVDRLVYDYLGIIPA